MRWAAAVVAFALLRMAVSLLGFASDIVDEPIAALTVQSELRYGIDKSGSYSNLEERDQL